MANATLRIWWFTNGLEFTVSEAALGLDYSPIGTKWLVDDGAQTVLSWGQRIRDKVAEMNRSWEEHWPPAKRMIEEARKQAVAELSPGKPVVGFIQESQPGKEAQAAELIRKQWSTVPTLAEWKKRSAVLVGYRKEWVLQMDQLLEEYDELRNQDPGLRNRDVVGRKLNTLKDLLWWAADHLCTRGAVTGEGRCCSWPPLPGTSTTGWPRAIDAARTGRI